MEQRSYRTPNPAALHPCSSRIHTGKNGRLDQSDNLSTVRESGKYRKQRSGTSVYGMEKDDLGKKLYWAQ
jgi:hypothetical protein